MRMMESSCSALSVLWIRLTTSHNFSEASRDRTYHPLDSRFARLPPVHDLVNPQLRIRFLQCMCQVPIFFADPLHDLPLQANAQKLFFARDPLGRRSMLIHKPSMRNPWFLLASVSVGSDLGYEFEELSTDYIHCLDLAQLANAPIVCHDFLLPRTWAYTDGKDRKRRRSIRLWSAGHEIRKGHL
jgi:hypothetical protein